jgi:hypothetical protein
MGNQLVPVPRQSRDGLHPSIYATIVALAAWFILSIWVLFGTNAYEQVTDVMVTFFFVMAIGIPATIWLTWRHHPEAHPGDDDGVHMSLRRWAAGAFQTWTGEQKAWQAAVEVLLPIVAVAFGITAFGLVFYFTVPSAP